VKEGAEQVTTRRWKKPCRREEEKKSKGKNKWCSKQHVIKSSNQTLAQKLH